jgi:DNA-binding NtrC family response regulator
MGQSKPFRRIAIVVEDDPIQREMIALLLEESDFSVIQCEDAETACLALKTRRRPSLLITDVSLTGKMNGVELARLARTNDPMLRVVIISGQHPAAVLPDGVTFLSKPVYPVALIREATH